MDKVRQLFKIDSLPVEMVVIEKFPEQLQMPCVILHGVGRSLQIVEVFQILVNRLDWIEVFI